MIFCYQILKTGNFQEGLYKKRKLTAGDSALVFTKDLEISLFGRFWTLDGFGLRRMQCVRINQLSERKTIVAAHITQEQNFLIIGLWFLLMTS